MCPHTSAVLPERSPEMRLDVFGIRNLLRVQVTIREGR
jgi:hypothetical protein